MLAAAVGPDGSVAALDATPELLQTARERLDASPFKSRVTYHEGDIQDLPFEDGRFDVAWSSRTIHHLPDQLAGMKELCRVLKPGGQMGLREGGIRPRMLPMDLGLGTPGLEDRLDVAFDQWFQANVRTAGSVVAYPFGWTQILTDAGLKEVTAKTFVLELLPPFDHVQVEYISRLLSRWVESDERRAFINDEDAEVIAKLIGTNGPHYAFNRPDLHFVEGVTVYTGKA